MRIDLFDMVTEVTLSAHPTTQQYGAPIVFSGRVIYNDEPMQGLTINVKDVATDTFLVAGETDTNGNYAVEWVPPFEWIGTFQVHTLAAMMEGFWSNKVTITVTEEEPPTPKMDILGKVGAILGSAGLVGIFVDSVRKR